MWAHDNPEQRTFHVPSDSKLQSPLACGVDVAYSKTKVIPCDPDDLREQRVILSKTRDALERSYSTIRTHMLQRMRTNQWKTVGITSPMSGNGKTITAINLAISLARDVNQTVLLADLDLIHPNLGSYFAPPEHPGLSEYLTGEAELADILIHPSIERLVILPGSHSFLHSAEILSSPRMIQLVQEIRDRYKDRVILFDMPPLLACDDVMAFLPNLDAVLLVIEEGKTSQDEIRRAEQLLGADKIIGIVLNKSQEPAATASYY